ncbi:MAG: hypothetical protein CFE43_18870 [Burkholderiales bacterium PBB3]|nr:MAG: hypothetical protein CFE43_18870 [Burkholderiales bacterium PBB3]
MNRLFAAFASLGLYLLSMTVASAASLASFDGATSLLTMPTVRIDSTVTFSNVVIKLHTFGSLAVEDPTVGTEIEYRSDGNRILLPSITVGTTTFHRVSLTGATFELVSAGGQVPTGGSAGSALPTSVSTLQGLKDTAFGTIGYRNTTSTAQSILKAVTVPGRKEVYLFTSHAAQGILGRSIVRFNEEGVLDTAYATNGLFEKADATLELSYGSFTVDSQGRAYVVSWPNGSNGPQGALVTRLDNTGKLDTSFGTGGSLKLNPSEAAGQLYSQIRVATALADDSILLAGYAATTRFGATRSWVIWKLLASGQLDTSFGSQGVASVATNAVDEPAVLSIAKSGDIYMSGRRADSAKTWVVTKFNAAGVQDTGYGVGGFASVGTGTALLISDMVVDPAGGLLAVGQATGTTNKPQGLITRLLANGTLDAAFGTAGRSFINFYNQPTPVVSDTFNDMANRVWLDASGRILVGGYALDKSFNGTATSYSTVVRLSSTGVLDTTFFGGAPTALAQASNYGFISRFANTNIWEAEVRPVFPSADGTYVIAVLLQANTSVHSFVRWK